MAQCLKSKFHFVRIFTCLGPTCFAWSERGNPVDDFLLLLPISR